MFDIAAQLEAIVPIGLFGSIVRTAGMTAAVADFPAPIGAVVSIERQTGGPVAAEVIGFRDDLTQLYLYEETHGIRRGNRVRLVRTARWMRVGAGLLGRLVNAHGACVDGRPQPVLADRAPLDRAPPPAFERPRIAKCFATGVRAIDGLLTCGQGQRMGIFAGSGVGKSTLLGMLARYATADVNVIALVGERGREVNEFIERDLGPTGLAKSVVVVATSDEPALVRVQAALAATAIAEYFRDLGKNVLLVMDSVTRLALAQREIGLAAGEPPTTRGLTPSVFAMLPRLLERSGRSATGSITAFYSVLVEGDDPNEPICDTVRGLLDGHTWLTRKLATRGHFPAIDLLESVSRLMADITTREHRDAAQVVRELLAVYRENEDLLSIGAYRRGGNRTLDAAVDMLAEINAWLRQRVEEPSSFEATRDGLLGLARRAAARLQAPPAATPGASGPVASNAGPSASSVAATGPSAAGPVATSVPPPTPPKPAPRAPTPAPAKRKAS